MTATQVCFVVGARPNFMKSAPIYRALSEQDPGLDLMLIHTGQHYDEGMSAVFFEELELPEPDLFLGVGSGTHAEQTAKVLIGVENVVDRVDHVLAALDLADRVTHLPRSDDLVLGLDLLAHVASVREAHRARRL